MLFVAVIAGAAAGVIDTALGATTASTGQSGGHSATTAPANGPLKTALVPAYLIPLFTGAAQNSGCGLTPALLAAQSKVESGYQVDAISSAGAVGIMQFLPSTWATEGIDGDHDGVASILDPADAIYSAAKLDCQNLDTIQTAGIAGDPIALMLAAYNAGLGTVQDCRCLPAITQTQNYVAEILRIAPTLATTPPPAAKLTVRPDDLPIGGAGHRYPDLRAACRRNFPPRDRPGCPRRHPPCWPPPTVRSPTPDGKPATATTSASQATAVLSTCYAHLGVIIVTLGESVTAGQQLGLEGATGDATGPHLHFEVRINGNTVDPASYLPVR